MKVDYIPVTECFHVTTGKLNSNAAVDGGEYPFFTCSKEASSIDKYAFDQEALLLAGNNAQGQYDVKYYHGKFNAYQRTYVLSVKSANYSYPYFKYALQAQLELLKASSKGTNTKYITMEILGRVLLPVPSASEQKRIAAILDKADAVHQKRKQAIDLADEFLRSVFLDMFGDYLGSSDNLVSFGDVTKLDAKMVDPTLDKYANLLHIGPDRIAKRTGEIFPALTAREEGLKSKKFLFSEQYVIYSKIRPYLRKAAIPEFVALCSADMYPIKPVDFKVTREFVWMLLLSDFFDNYVCTLPDRASIPKLNKKELAAFQFSLPSFDEIQKFSFIVKEILKTKNTLQDHQLNSINLFSALSQKAFSGQL